MELQFKKEPLSWMETAVSRVQNQELTQELKLSDGMPDVGRVLSAWGQFVLRSKEWRGGGFSASGGMMVWVLYAPEDGSQPRCIHGWIPGQWQWDVPSDTPEGQIRISCRVRFVDARSVSPRKILVRAGVAALGEGCVRREGCTWVPGEVEKDVQLLHRTYPLTLMTEVGEKTLQLEELLSLPQSAPEPEKLICTTVQPEITEQKVLGSRIVFRGDLNLHVLYLSREGQLHSWDFPVNFSQYDELSQSHGQDTRSEVLVMPTDLDAELQEDGQLRVKCGLVAQYALEDGMLLKVVEDAYSPNRELEVKSEQLELPVVLEEKTQNMTVQTQVPLNGDIVVDTSILPDFPRVRRIEDSVELEVPGMVQALASGLAGALQGGTARWEGKLSIPAHPQCSVRVLPGGAGQIRAENGGDGISVRAQLPLDLKTTAVQSIPMVSALTLGECVRPDPQRPSLILCRAGEESLWQLARSSGSTVDAIREATGLEGEPVPGQMLLIPVL